MNLSNVDFTVLYVDPSAASSGDGSTPDNAMKTLPQLSSDVPDKTCYLIRRTADGEVTLPKGENSGITAMAVIGMPKATDELYLLMPEEAKTAWGADTADYANVKSETSAEPYGGEYQALILPNCQTFFLYRINLYRENRGAFEACVQLTNGNVTATVSVERCRFGLKGFVLESETCTQGPSYGSAMFISANKPQVFSFRHNVINFVSDPGGYFESSSWCVYVQYAAFADVFDVDIWAATTSFSGGGYGYEGGCDPVLHFGYYSEEGDYSRGCDNANFDKITCHYLRYGTKGYLPRVLQVNGREFISVRNITLDMSERQLGNGTPSVVSPSGCLVICDSAGEFIFENMTATLPQVWRIFSGCQIFKLSWKSASQFPGCARKIENIHIALGTTNGIDTARNGNYYEECKGDWNSYAALVLSIYSDAAHDNFSDGAHEAVIVKNIDVVHPRGVALYASSCYVRNATLQGMLRASSATCDVTSLGTWYPGYAIGARSGSTVRVGTLALGKGNIAGYDSDPAIIGSPQESSSYIYVGTSNGALMSDVRSTNTGYDNCYAVICGSEQDAGHYTMRSINAVCNTWGVVRSGSTHTASLKLYNNSASGKGFLSLGRQPFGGFIIEDVAAGQRVLKIHIATKGLSETAELARRLVAQVTVPQPDGSKEVVFSSTRGRWTADGSTWIGEANLSGYLLEVPLNLASQGDVDVKIHFNWYSASGYLYIDPDFVIE